MNIDDWQKERVMTAKQYRKTIEALALNVAQAGRFIGVSERTSHRYIRGERPVPALDDLRLPWPKVSWLEELAVLLTAVWRTASVANT